MRKLEMEKGLEVWILRRDEVAEAEKEKLLLSQSLKKIMETPRSCKMEKIGEYYAGTMKIPRKEKGDGMTFGFFSGQPGEESGFSGGQRAFGIFPGGESRQPGKGGK